MAQNKGMGLINWRTGGTVLSIFLSVMTSVVMQPFPPFHFHNEKSPPNAGFRDSPTFPAPGWAHELKGKNAGK